MWYYDGRIRIKPDWNVKVFSTPFQALEAAIRIKPDWNVKLTSPMPYLLQGSLE